MSFLSHNLQRVKQSPTMQITAKAQELKASGIDIISLSVGEPDFDTPENIKNAGIQAILNGKTKYTAADGMPELKEAICKKLLRDNNLKYNKNQVIVSTGGKQVLFNALLATLNPGDEVIIPAPYWVSYPDMVFLGGGTPVIAKAKLKNNFKLTAEELEAAITPKTKWLIFNSPSNPTGAGYNWDELHKLTGVLMRHPHVWVMTDDMYEYLAYDNFRFCTPAEVEPKLYDRTLTTNGVSKAYAMTGWRIGYAAGPITLIKAMGKIQSQSTSCACSISQAAAKAALDNNNDEVHKMVNEYQIRSAFLHSELNQIDGIKYKKPEGSFYAFVDVNGLIDKIENINDDFELAEYFLNEAGVAVVPGTAFGSKNHIRISFATSLENLKKAVDRIKKLLS